MEEAFFDVPLYLQFAQLDAHGRLPDENTILRFGKTPSPRHGLEKHKLAEQILATVNDLHTAKGLLLKAGTAVNSARTKPNGDQLRHLKHVRLIALTNPSCSDGMGASLLPLLALRPG